MVSINPFNSPSLSGLSEGQFDSINVSDATIGQNLTVLGNINQITANTTATFQILRSRDLRVTEPSGGQLTIFGNQFRFDGNNTPSFSGKGLYLSMMGGQQPALFLCSDSVNNRYIAFATANGTTLATIQSWTNNAGDLRFTTNGLFERFRIYANGLSEFYGNVNLSSGNSLQIEGLSVLNSSTLGSSIINSSLTSLGVLNSLNVSGSAIVNGGVGTPSISLSGVNTSISPPIWITGVDLSTTKEGWKISVSSGTTPINGADDNSSSSWQCGSNLYNTIDAGGLSRSYSGSVTTTLLDNTVRSGEWYQYESPLPYGITNYSLNWFSLSGDTLINARIPFDCSLLGSLSGLNGSWEEISVFTGGLGGGFSMSFSINTENRFIPFRFFRIVFTKINNRSASGNNDHFATIASQTLIFVAVPLSVRGLSNLSGSLRISGNLLSDSLRNITANSLSLGASGITSSLNVSGAVNLSSSLNVTGNITNATNLLTTNVTNRNVGINTVSPSAYLHIVSDRTVNDPTQNGLLIHNTTSNSSGHSYCTLRTNNASGGNPCLSMDVLGVAGWSFFCDNADNQALKIRSTWDMNGGSATECIRIDRVTRRINLNNEVVFRQRFYGSMSVGGNFSYASGTNVAYVQNVLQDTSGTASIFAGIMTLPTNYPGYYTITFSGRVTDGTILQGALFFANNDNLFGTSDGTYWLPSDPGNRRCYSFSRTVFLNAGAQIRSRFVVNTQIDMARCEVVYHGVQS
jgi:hypothetical protein